MSANDDDRDGRLRILFVTSDWFPPFRPAAKAIFADELSRRGHVVDWILQAETESVSAGAQPFRNGTAFVAANNNGKSIWRRQRKHLQALSNDLRIFGLLKRHRYSAVQVKDKYLGALIAIVAAKCFGVPVFYWLAYPHAEWSLYAARHGTARYPFVYLIRGWIQKWLLYRVIMPASRHVFVQSEQMRRDIASEGIPWEKMTPVPSSVNLDDLPSEGAGASLKPADERWIVYLGTLIRDRQLDMLLRVLREVLSRRSDVRLLFVGAGENPQDEAFLRSEAARLGVDSAMRITGWLPINAALAYVQAADVCLSPYSPVPILQSTSPTKLVEYMALGKPVVANDHPEQSLVIEQSGGGLACAWDEHAFATAVLQLLDHPDEARAMGAAGRRFVEEHRTHSKMADAVEDVYRRILPEGTVKLRMSIEARGE